MKYGPQSMCNILLIFIHINFARICFVLRFYDVFPHVDAVHMHKYM